MNGDVEDVCQHFCLAFSLAILLVLTREISDLNEKYYLGLPNTSDRSTMENNGDHVNTGSSTDVDATLCTRNNLSIDKGKKVILPRSSILQASGFYLDFPGRKFD